MHDRIQRRVIEHRHQQLKRQEYLSIRNQQRVKRGVQTAERKLGHIAQKF